jgi:predicted transposase/invertase (TIGR01784 family)
MRRDTLFYQLFKQFPGLIFELVDQKPPEAAEYQFDSIEVKETAFRIDGVFLPPDHANPKIAFFAEVQFQEDKDLYHRFFTEIMTFLYRHKVRYDNWFGVIIFPSRSLEPSNYLIHDILVDSYKVKRIYLDELGNLENQSLGIGLMLLTNTPENKAREAAKTLLKKAQNTEVDNLEKQAIIDLVTKIMTYKFNKLTREEVEAMLLGPITEEPRAVRDWKEMGAKTEAVSLVVRQLNRRFGKVPDVLLSKVEQFSIGKIETLAEDLLDFSVLQDLENWLQQNQSHQ